jgi:phage recombination protein Bet
METKLSRIEPRPLAYGFTDEQIALIKRTIAKEATDHELELFLYHAKRMGLDPLARQIYFQKYTNRKTGETTMTIIVAIDGYRLIADRTGLYAGNDDPVFDNEDIPKKATVSVYKVINGVRCAFTASARWDQYCPAHPKDYFWKKMPHLMLGKVAESLALRKAFPAELSGTYTEEEMQQAAGGVPSLTISEDQWIRAHQIAKLRGISNEKVRAILLSHDFKEPREITIDHYEAIVQEIEQSVP